jgi:hypothetical protein
MFFTVYTAPGPSIPKDGLRDDMEGCGFRTVVGSPDSDECFCLIFVVFGVFDDDIPIAVVVEDFCVEDFEFRDVAVAVGAFADELVVGIRCLRVFIEHFHVGMSWSGILIISSNT